MIHPASRLALLPGALPRLEVQYLSTVYQEHLHPTNLEAQPARFASKIYLTALASNGAHCGSPRRRSVRGAARQRESGIAFIPAPEPVWRWARSVAFELRRCGRHGQPWCWRAGTYRLRPQARVLAREPRVQDRPDLGVSLHPLRRAFNLSEL